MDNKSLILAAIIGFIGIFLIVIGIRLIIKKRRFMKFAIKKNGVVVDLVKKRNTGSVSYHPKVEFTDHSGKKIQFSSSIGIERKEGLHKVGDHVDVLYDPEDNKIDLAENVRLRQLGLIFPVAFIFFGLTSIAMSLLILFLPAVK